MMQVVMPRCLRAIATAATLICALIGGTAAAEELRIAGTGNALGTARLLAKAFSKNHPDIAATVLNRIGSGGAVKAVPKGAVEIGLSPAIETALRLAEKRPGLAIAATDQEAANKIESIPGAVRTFLDFVRSPTGREILTQTGHWIP